MPKTVIWLNNAESQPGIGVEGEVEAQIKAYERGGGWKEPYRSHADFMPA